ncbi:MAG TPA: serine/threonine-protein kinase, partial [Kofleriaceae bacterium]
MVSTAISGGSGASDGSDILPAGAKAGPWQVERELGRGGMGAVYAVVHEEIGKRAALKVVHQRLLVPGFNSDRMMLEAKVVNQVGHPNIVDIFETGKLEDGRPYIVMERLDGRSLAARADEGKLLPDQVIAVLMQVCDALIAAHKTGVIHRDLKLDNVFLVDNAEDPASPKVKLLDWGIAKVLTTDVKHTIEGQLVGTPQYLAPEQARGHEVSPQTDVYSLGVMAYELFLEQLPFEAETAAEVMAMHLRATPPPPSDLWPDIPQVLEDLLLAMLAKQAAHRPTVAEVVRRLEQVRGELVRRRESHQRIP